MPYLSLDRSRNRWSPPYQLIAVDPADGHPLCGYSPFPLRAAVGKVAFSPARQQAAFFDYPPAGGAGRLHLVDLAAWQATTTTLTAPEWAVALAYDPPGDRLAGPTQTPSPIPTSLRPLPSSC